MTEVIHYTLKQSSLGSVLIAQSDKRICAIFIDDNPAFLVERLSYYFKEATFQEKPQALEEVANTLINFIEDPHLPLTVTFDVRGTPFQRKVWTLLQQIPLGQTATYTDLAYQLGLPHHRRAVGRACGDNPLAVVIPCHRVIRKDGNLAGYRWGLNRKQKLLEAERKLLTLILEM
ncbi:MAG: methylated-DNA--[protein]-cysteine S-methyltransferase [Candidatus Paracaedibacteraceae bacterium]|nr:methylated-DNA--[protein]-cysteine S-methyltransferase [Candidatus Paracaedibacteraceae bacterium]